MPTVTASLDIAGTDAGQVWAVVEDPGRYVPLAGHILRVVREGTDTEWSALLNGSRVGWVQRETARPPRSLSFEQTDGDFDRLRGEWTVLPGDGGVRLALAVEFDLGIDGLAPLLEPMWAQSLQAHAVALVHAVARAARPDEAP